MSDEHDKGKRDFLVGVTAGMGTVATGAVLVPFVASWGPSERAKAAGAPVEVDLSKIQPGEMQVYEWRGKPVWILRRTKEMLATLRKLTDSGRLVDPHSEVPQQPEYCKNEFRSQKDEYLVVVGICTHLGCSPTFRPDAHAADLGAAWPGGYFCPCHGSRFDFAARVFKSMPAPKNLVIPPHTYLSDTTVLIGVDPEVA